MAKKNSKADLIPDLPWEKISRLPWVTFLLVLAQGLVYLWEKGAMNVGVLGYLIDDYDFNWSLFIESPFGQSPRLISHAFFHANGEHLVSNVVFFLLFGPAIEKRLGPSLFFVYYFVWGAVGALTQGVFSPYSPGLIGASGAISGAAGAFFVLYPLKTPSEFLSFMFGGILRRIPAFIWIGLWFVNQLRLGVTSLLPTQLSDHISQVGYWAHIGGFAAGALTVVPLVFKKRA